MPDCIVPGCALEARNNLSLRLRRPDTSAIWAPNLDAFVCDVHATAGARVRVVYEATTSGAVETHVLAVDDDFVRVTEIRQAAQRLATDLADAARDSAGDAVQAD